MIRPALLGAIAALLLAGSPAWAQEPTRRQPPAAKSATKSVRERALEKLRALETAGRPSEQELKSAADSAAAADSTGAVPGDSARTGVRAGAPAEVRDTAGAPAAGGPPRTPAVGGAPGDPPETTAGTAMADSVGVPADTARVLVRTDFAPDSMMLALRALDGYTVTEYQAERARFDADSAQLQLLGNPVLTRGGQGMKADSLLSYDQETSIICGYGKPVLDGAEGEPVESEQVCYDVDRRQGMALGARTTFTEGATWFVHGQELYTAGTDRLYGAGTEFTSCELDTPHYHFAAKSMKIVHNDILVARSVTLNFGDVPVFWLPFMAQSLKQGRRSGLLTPNFGVNDIARTSTGYQRQLSNLGFFWAINDHLGSWMWMDWRSNDYTRLTGRLEFNWARQFLRGTFDFGQAWEAEGGTNRRISSNASWQPDERTSIQLSGSLLTSTRFLKDRTFDPAQLSQDITSNAGITRRFDWGSLNLSASQSESLMEQRKNVTLPSVSLSISPITLFPATGETRWYNNAALNGSMSFRSTRKDVDENLFQSSARDGGDMTASAGATFRIGNLSWNQDFSFDQGVLEAKPQLFDTTSAPADSVTQVDTLEAMPYSLERDVRWSTGLSYSQRLIGTSTFSPSLSLSGAFRQPDTLNTLVAAPARLSVGAGLNGDIFGFWPGAGPFSRIRHRVSPSLSYQYSPELDSLQLTQLQREVFGGAGSAERNQLRLTINQTFEAKYEEADTAADTAAALEPAAPGEPRRLPQTKKITLLSLRTSAMVYDFTRGTGHAFTTTDLTHSISSDLLRGLTLRVGHDLFREGPGDSRTFSPRLRSVNTGFSLDGDSWLFRVLGLGRAPTPDSARADSAALPGDSTFMEDPFGDPTGRIDPITGVRSRSTGAGRSGPVGSWRANFDYMLSRPPEGSETPANQQLNFNFSFQPTEKWSVSWRSSYSFTDGEFSDHSLRLTRDLHRWRANFDFLKAQNGNFMFRFFVNLLDNSDLKLDYEQRGENLGTRGPR